MRERTNEGDQGDEEEEEDDEDDEDEDEGDEEDEGEEEDEDEDEEQEHARCLSGALTCGSFHSITPECRSIRSGGAPAGVEASGRLNRHLTAAPIPLYAT